MTFDTPSDAATLRELRQTRQAKRLGDTEWFDLLYRVYLFALVGLTAVVVASDAIEGVIPDDLTTAELLTRGPSIAGIAVAVAFAVGLRNGADGGPVSVEPADIRHLLLSPIDRRRALLRPTTQRIRAVMFPPAIVLAILGQLAAREIDGSRAAWAGSGALFGVLLGAVYAATAVVAHGVGIRRWVASLVGAAVVGWQSLTAVAIWSDGAMTPMRFGPANLAGSVLFWGIRQRLVDLIALTVTLSLVALALALAGRLRLEPLERRGQLVSQLRFAATVQDIRTVVLIRRQLRAEAVRSTPWFGIGSRRRSADHPLAGSAQGGGTRRARPHVQPSIGSAPSATIVWRRGLASLARLPLARLLRIAVLAVVAGLAGSLAITSSPLFALALLATLFLLGLEAIEPLAQEVDRPDLTDSVPLERGWLFLHHLVAPAALLVCAAFVGAIAAAVREPGHLGGALLVALPVAFGGAIGPIVSTVKDAPDPTSVAATNLMGVERSVDSPFAMPEFAGASNAITGLVPIVFSTAGVLPVLAMRVDAGVGTGVRAIVGVALCLAVMARWIIRRDAWAVRVRRFFAEGRAAT